MGGLGATPQAAPPMAPGMAAPAPQAPPGMAEGGIVGLDVPEGMFDEPSNGGFDDGYAGGGLVAFADGGELDAAALRRALRAQESSGDYGILNAEGSGAMGAYQFMPATARALAKRLGIAYRPELMQGAGGRSKEGMAYQERLMDEQMKDIMRFSKGDPKLAAAYHFAGPNRAGWKEDTTKYQSDILRRLGSKAEDRPAAPANAPTGGVGTIPGVPTPPSLESLISQSTTSYDKLVPAPKREARDAILAYAKELGDPEQIKKQATEDKWMTLAQIGFSMAASNSPYLLQAVGAAAAAAIPGAKEDKKAREARKREALRMYADVEGLDNQDAKERVNGILGLAKTKYDMSNNEISRIYDWAKTKAELENRVTTTGMQVQGQKDVAGITADSYAHTAKAQEATAMRQAAGRANAAALEETNARFKPLLRPKDPTAAAKFDADRDAYYKQRYSFYLRSEGFGGAPEGATGGTAGGQDKVVNVVWPTN
jgi:hypothetical protein